MKQKLNQKLRAELSGVLNMSSSKSAEGAQDNGLQRDKSGKDIMIKQRIEQKRKNFA